MDSDLLFGIFITALFLVFVFAAGVVLYKFKNMRFSKAWQPLVPIINGRVQGDGGGAATSWLVGAYKAKAVHARMSPNANDVGRSGSSTTGFAYNAFEIVMRDVAGAQDWSMSYHAPYVGSGTLQWRIITKDVALQQRLHEQGVVAMIASLGHPSSSITAAGLPVMSYSARDQQLCYREDCGPDWLPVPERFREELETVLRVADINAQVNTVAAKA